MSVFVALEPSPPVRAHVAQLIDGHRAIEAKWQRAEKLHVTLVFLGNPTPEQCATFAARLDETVARHAEFSVRLAGAGCFETMRAPAVLWLGVGGDLPALHALQTALASSLGVTTQQPYVPHLTLARAQAADAFAAVLPQLATLRADPFQVRAVTLFESTHHAFRALHSSRLATGR